MKKKERVEEILKLLDEYYPTETKCYLNYNTPEQLLISTMLSAQCTDDRVNSVTEKLFIKYKDLESFSKASLEEMEKDIKPTGFYRNKAKNIIATSQIILKEFKGILPEDIEKLIKLPGVGRKTANVVRSHIFNIPSIVVDTHVKRISKKLGITKFDDPVKIEFELMKILPKDHWIRYNTQMIAHGRKICKAPTPKCEICQFTKVCKTYNKIKGENKNDSKRNIKCSK